MSLLLDELVNLKHIFQTEADWKLLWEKLSDKVNSKFVLEHPNLPWCVKNLSFNEKANRNLPPHLKLKAEDYFKVEFYWLRNFLMVSDEEVYFRDELTMNIVDHLLKRETLQKIQTLMNVGRIKAELSGYRGFSYALRKKKKTHDEILEYTSSILVEKVILFKPMDRAETFVREFISRSTMFTKQVIENHPNIDWDLNRFKRKSPKVWDKSIFQNFDMEYLSETAPIWFIQQFPNHDWKVGIIQNREDFTFSLLDVLPKAESTSYGATCDKWNSMELTRSSLLNTPELAAKYEVFLDLEDLPRNPNFDQDWLHLIYDNRRALKACIMFSKKFELEWFIQCWDKFNVWKDVAKICIPSKDDRTKFTSHDFSTSEEQVRKIVQEFIPTIYPYKYNSHSLHFVPPERLPDFDLDEFVKDILKDQSTWPTTNALDLGKLIVNAPNFTTEWIQRYPDYFIGICKVHEKYLIESPKVTFEDVAKYPFSSSHLIQLFDDYERIYWTLAFTKLPIDDLLTLLKSSKGKVSYKHVLLAF